MKSFKGGLTAPPRPEPPVVEDESSEDEDAEEEAGEEEEEEEEEWGRSSYRGDTADAARRRTYILKSALYGVTLHNKYSRALTLRITIGAASPPPIDPMEIVAKRKALEEVGFPLFFLPIFFGAFL